MGFAGSTAGTIFEGEKQFDLVVRFDKEHRQDIDNIETASILLPNGNKLPLREFASISAIPKGPAKISRDNTKRRIVVGVNVRNRDLESVVTGCAENCRTAKSALPPGYSITYGGQFENLRTAKERLMVAVPIALVLIFVLLYFAFNSVKEALMIYSAIPLAAVGGVLLLYLRGMPFSISAGVGFIALFGIAVLNGIVLIEEFKELKARGVHDIHKRILLGTQNRLRPVLLTAAAAALGFLPMAISTSAGAEVQRPLATVVVGGLISATALTLIVLPVLYALLDKTRLPVKKGARPAVVAGILFLLLSFTGQAQSPALSPEQAVRIALQNNRTLQAATERVEQNRQLVGTAFKLDKTLIYYHFDQNNIATNGLPLKVWGISQSFEFPTIYGARKKVLESGAALAAHQYALEEKLLRKEVLKAYYRLLYWQNVVNRYAYLDSLYTHFVHAASRRYEVGETNYLEKLTAVSKEGEIALQLQQSQESKKVSEILLAQWLQSDSLFALPEEELPRLALLPFDTLSQGRLSYYQTARELAKRKVSLEQQQLLPDLQLSLFQGTNQGDNATHYNGYQLGVAVPLWFGSARSRIKASKTEVSIAVNEFENYQIQLKAHYKSLLAELQKYAQGLQYYKSNGKVLTQELSLHAEKAFRNGEIDFLQFVQLLERAQYIELNYLENLLKYNETILEANYLTD